MPIDCSHLRWFVAGLVVALTSMSTTVARAQTTPKIEFLFPPGAQRGTEVEVQLGGEYMPGACRLTMAGGGIALQPAAGPNRYRFSVAKDAVTGPHETRLSSVQGASPPFPFVVGELPEVVHEDNREPQELKLPVTANGRLAAANDLDEYAITLAAGQQIVCAATTRAIRWLRKGRSMTTILRPSAL